MILWRWRNILVMAGVPVQGHVVQAFPKAPKVRESDRWVAMLVPAWHLIQGSESFIIAVIELLDPRVEFLVIWHLTTIVQQRSLRFDF